MTDFWSWAVKAYARPEVAEACLDLQDSHGQCVPLLLWAAWMALQGETVESVLAEQAVAMARPWADEVIAPLRELRRRLKTGVAPEDDSVRLPLREKIKAAELQAEKGLMTQLETLSLHAKPCSGQGIAQTCHAALVAVSHAWRGSPPVEPLSKLAQALTKG